MSRSLGANILKLLSSKIATQAAAFLTAPIIARLFSPGDFGIRQIFMSITAIIAIVSCLRYELSIPLGKDKNESSASFVLSTFLIVIFTLITLAAVMVSKGKVAQWFKSPELEKFLWLLPAAIFLVGLEQSLKYLSASEGKFGWIAWSEFSHTLGGILITLAYALLIEASAAGLFAGYIAGVAFGDLLLLLPMGRELVSRIKNAHLNLGVLWAVAKRYRKFPIFDIWSGLLNSISVQAPSIILGLYFSITIVGHYSLGYRMVSLPMVLLGTSIAQVFFPTAAKQYNEMGDLSEIASNVFRRLLQVGTLPIIALGFLGAPLFGFLFGEKWIEAGIYTQILSGFILFQFMSSPLSTILIILQLQSKLLAFNVCVLSSRILALLIGAIIGGPRISLAAFSIVSSIGYIYMLFWALRRSSVSLRWGVETLLKYIVLSCLLLLPAVYLAWALRSIAIVLISLGLAVIVYVYALYRFDLSIRNVTASIVARTKREVV